MRIPKETFLSVMDEIAQLFLDTGKKPPSPFALFADENGMLDLAEISEWYREGMPEAAFQKLTSYLAGLRQ